AQARKRADQHTALEQNLIRLYRISWTQVVTGASSMGYIRRLEVKGFKSFGPKTLTITFEQGLNVVTGPNGSGKSNIADAILFALGENSPRILRAAQGRLTGLIYDPKRE